jgi:hypothetical protein
VIRHDVVSLDDRPECTCRRAAACDQAVITDRRRPAGLLPAGRLRTKGKTDAIVIVTDGQPVGIMMPLQPPSK